MKTPEQWSEEIVTTDAASDGGLVIIRVGSRQFVLKSAVCQQHARALREIIAAGLRAFGQEILASASRQETLTRPQASATPPAQLQDGCANGVPVRPVATDKGPIGRVLLGLPCPRCGAFFDSRSHTCPICSTAKPRACDKAPEAAGNSSSLARCSEADNPLSISLPPKYSDDSLRQGIGAEIVDACVRYGARMERMEAALGMSPEEGGKVIYEALFPAHARLQPWEQCPAEFRAGYLSRVAVLLDELRRRAGLEPLNGGAEFTIDAERGEIVRCPTRFAS